MSAHRVLYMCIKKAIRNRHRCVPTRLNTHPRRYKEGFEHSKNGAVCDLRFCCGTPSLKNIWSCFSFASNYTKTFCFCFCFVWLLDTRLCYSWLPKRQYQDGLTRGSETQLPKMPHAATEHAHGAATGTRPALPRMDRSLSSCGWWGDVI